MIFRFSSYFFFVITVCTLAFPWNLDVQINEAHNTIVLSQIISNYIRRYLSHESHFISLVHASSNAKQTHFHEEVTANLYRNPNLTDFSHYTGSSLIVRRNVRRHTFNIILIDDTNSLSKILNGFDTHVSRLSEKFMIIPTVDVMPNATNNLNQIFEILWKNRLLNVNVLIQDQPQFWTLYTFMPYQNGCSNLTAIKIESFTPSNYTDNSTVRKDQLFPKKLKNFNRCPLKVTSAYKDPFVMHSKTANENNETEGIEIDIIQQISKSLNFTIVFHWGDHGSISPNNTITGNLKLVVDGEVEIDIGGHGLSKEGNELLSPTYPYVQVSVGFSFIETEAYSPFTRLMAPFQNPVWIAIGLIVFASMAVILLTKQLSQRWRHFYIGGRMNRSPILNMWNAVLGLSVANPEIMNGHNFSNFARILAMLWSILWLVIRSAHQGALYEYLQANRSTSPYDTIEKIRKSDCGVIVPPVMFGVVKDTFDEKRIILGRPSFDQNLLNLYEPNEKCIVVLSSDLIQKCFNLKKSPDHRLPFTKDRLFMFAVGIYLRKKSMLNPIFNHQLQLYREAGLIDLWIRKYIDDSISKSKYREPSKLHMENVIAAFQICGILCFISFIVFILEIFSLKYRRVQLAIDYLTY